MFTSTTTPRRPAMASLPLPELAMLALCAALGCAELLVPILDFLANGMSSPARSAAVDMAIAAALLALLFFYLGGVFLVYLSVTPPAAASTSQAAPKSPRYLHAAASLLMFFAGSLIVVAFFIFMVLDRCVTQ